MKRSFFLLMLACLVLTLSTAGATAAQKAAEPITIEGPDTLDAGDARLYLVKGLTDWKDCNVATLPEDSGAMAVALTDAAGSPVLYVQAPAKPKKPEIHLVLDVNKAGNFRLVVKTVPIGEEIKPLPDPPQPPDPPGPGVNPWRPSSNWKSASSKILALKLSRQDATALASLYGNLSRPASLDSLATTGQLRQRLIQEGASLGLHGRYPGLADAINEYLAVSVRRENVALNKEAAAQVLETLAWAVWETGGSP